MGVLMLEYRTADEQFLNCKSSGGYYLCDYLIVLNDIPGNLIQFWEPVALRVYYSEEKIIFVDVQKVPVYTQAEHPLFFPSVSLLIPSICFHSISFSVASHPVSNQLLEGDQNVGRFCRPPARNKQYTPFFLITMPLSRELTSILSTYTGSKTVNKGNIYCVEIIVLAFNRLEWNSLQSHLAFNALSALQLANRTKLLIHCFMQIKNGKLIMSLFVLVWMLICLRLDLDRILFLCVCLSYSLDCVLPDAPVSLVQFLHVQSEFGHAELLNGEFIVGSTP